MGKKIKVTDEQDREEVFTEDEFQGRLNRSYESGQMQGLLIAAAMLSKESAEYFSRGMDKEAFLLRDFSKSLREKEDFLHKEYKVKYGI